MAAGARDGSARPIPANRLANFEGQDQEASSAPSLPARPRPAARPAPTSGPARGDDSVRSATGQVAPTGPPAPVRAAPPRAAQSPIHASNALIPMRLMPLVVEHCKTHSIAHGTLIVTALEANAHRLAELVTPTPLMGGGGLFPALATSKTGPRASGEEQIVPLTFRLPREHFEVLDQLVIQVKAPSRSKLISAALAAYLEK